MQFAPAIGRTRYLDQFHDEFDQCRDKRDQFRLNASAWAVSECGRLTENYTQASIAAPGVIQSLTVDPAGRLYFAAGIPRLGLALRVRRIAHDGTISTIAGGG